MSLDRQTRYRRIVGGMLYTAMATRPDVAYAVGMLTRCLASPKDELLKEAGGVLIYLYNTRTLAITYRSSMCGTPVRCNWAPTLGPVTDGAIVMRHLRQPAQLLVTALCCPTLRWPGA
eukprot:1414096-Pleurochrysis_carterae.AAC.1